MDALASSSPFKRDPSLPKGRQAEDHAIAEVIEIIEELPLRKDLLIEALHLIQDTQGHLSSDHLVALADLLDLSQVEVFEVASFYHHFDVVKEESVVPPALTVRVCDGLSCSLNGAVNLIKKMKKLENSHEVRIQNVPCIGRCDSAPAAQVGKRAVEHATEEKLVKAITAPTTPIIPKYENLADYVQNGGYLVLNEIVSGVRTKESVIEIMSNAGLRGLGGAGFPAGKKWGFVLSYMGPRLMTVNGDEGEPGTFKDRFWMEKHPHRMLEGAQIAAHVTGCSKIYLYIRDEYPAVIDILKVEIKALEGAGIAIIPFEIRRGAGAYICGEESAMIESIEGKRGLPRHRPPYIAEVGLFDRPTLNHNIETLFWIPKIISNGAEWFSSQGYDEKHKGFR